jgi:aspartate kinase
MFKALAEAGINLQMITTSEIKISALVAREQSVDALRSLHAEFELDKEPAGLTESDATSYRASTEKVDALAVVSELQDMEELLIDGIDLDSTQGRVTLHGVQDKPGVAAMVFNEISKAGIVVDMIVQSHLETGEGEISFTVPATDVATAVSTLESMSTDAIKNVSSSASVAKLSVSGIGLRSHTGVAIRMFKALADAGINVQIISTSEVRVNVIVAGEDADAGLKCLQAAFEDVLR